MRLLVLIFSLVTFGPNFLNAIVNIRKAVSYCQVTEKKFSTKFNFSGLLNPSDDYIVKHGDISVRFQPCGPLVKICKDEVHANAVCLVKNGQEIVVGKDEPVIINEWGKIIYNYTGDICDKRHKYNVNIIMMCDYAASNNGIKLDVDDYNDCIFTLIWRTKFACPEPKTVDCKLDYKSDHYDLTSLINLSENYKIVISDRYSVILNICHSILLRPNSCSSTNAICLVDKDTHDSKNLGVPSGNLTINPTNNNTLQLHYKNGGLCANPNATNLSIESTINFICDLNAIGTFPQYEGGMDKCHYNFTWKTAAACSEQSLHNKSLEIHNDENCTVKDPLTNHLYNLTGLKTKQFNVTIAGTTEIYRFTVCGTISHTACKVGTGACKVHARISDGMGNSKLMWKQSGPYLNYTNGDFCSNNHQIYTVIEFYCGQEDFEINTFDTEPDKCFNVIKMHTELVCYEKKQPCVTVNNPFNFESLKLKSYNYLAKTNDSEYHINVCRSLVSEKGLNCPPEAAICKTTTHGKEKSGISLGTLGDGPIEFTETSAVLIYPNGTICKENTNKTIESRILFLCDFSSGDSSPTFHAYKSCTYFFEWKTSKVCGNVKGVLNSNNCSLISKLGDTRNLLVLNEIMGPVYKVGNKEKKEYKTVLCGDKKECNDSFVCDDKMNYGTKVDVYFNYSDNSIRLHFTNGSKCADGTQARSTLTLVCREQYIESQPVLIKESPCTVEFEWQTNRICSKKSSELSMIITSNSHGLNEAEITAIVIFVLVVIMIVIFYFRNKSSRSHLVGLITNTTSRNYDRVKYSRVCCKRYRRPSLDQLHL